MSSPRDRFDADYYRRFYRDKHTRVTDAKTTARLARFVRAYLDLLGLDVRTAVDLGCGLGWWGESIRAWRPSCRYTGVEVSGYLVDEFGWQPGSVIDYASADGTPFDLVICQGVLQYLPNKDAATAIDNVAGLTSRALYLEALTTEDWRDNCDTDRTDGAVHLRTGRWYRQRLRPNFHNCGGGLFVRRGEDLALFDLEHLD